MVSVSRVMRQPQGNPESFDEGPKTTPKSVYSALLSDRRHLRCCKSLQSGSQQGKAVQIRRGRAAVTDWTMLVGSCLSSYRNSGKRESKHANSQRSVRSDAPDAF